MLADRGYAGELNAAEAWRMMEEDPDAILIDVRTVAEWVYVGLPDISRLGRGVVCVQWATWPDMRPNPDFVPHVEAEGVPRGRPLLLLCRSGVRSRHAAVKLTQAGFGPCYNVTDGFEGDLDGNKHRGIKNGWRHAGLPWAQQ